MDPGCKLQKFFFIPIDQPIRALQSGNPSIMNAIKGSFFASFFRELLSSDLGTDYLVNRIFDKLPNH